MTPTEERAHRTPDGTLLRAGWTRAGGDARFAWVHVPPSGEARGAVVLCSPLLAEEYHSHRAVALLANRLAAAGFAALRFDYTGTGDSSGRPEDVADVAIWREDIAAMVRLARAWGAGWVAAVGLRAAANLLVPVPGPDAFVFWDPVRSGRSFVREVTLLHRSTTAAAGCTDDDSLAGYPFPAGFVRSLSEVAGIATPGPSTRTLLLTRDGSLPVGCDPTAETEVRAAPQQPAMLEVSLHRSRIPEATIQVIVEWLRSGRPEDSPRIAPTLSPTWSDGVVEESAEWMTNGDGESMFAVASRPASGPGARTRLVLLNSGAQSHIGPHRMHVDLARSLAGYGVGSLRVDLPGRGDSPPGSGSDQLRPFAGARVSDVAAVVERAGGGAVVAMGLCSGAWDALDAANLPGVRGAVCINLGSSPAIAPGAPLDRDPGTSLRRAVVERRWLRWLRRTAIGTKIVWHLPGPVWWVLDKTLLQPDASRAVARVAGRGRHIALLVAQHDLRDPRLWSSTHATRGRWSVVSFGGDTDLIVAPGRAQVTETCRELVREWAAAWDSDP
ncbi:alpha/beta fold hydrolase [Acidimicrobiaceae bacterium USS-CC1]|uniref:Alpha/beta fold hydrolase n=1 Tax=Acidiferrimicrobium australe TaxID=2664430 RepID=A0ABW9QRQ6_9ACTN|nr:alpha/beta fold hydrolase [Acidiferrimicrobium australe]